MKALAWLEEQGIPITWETVRLGLLGFDDLPPTISGADVAAYAERRAASAGELPPALAELLAVSPATPDLMIEPLSELARGERTDWALEVRKWRLALVDDLMNSLPDDPIDALTDMTSFWARFDYPSDSPHIVQGRGNRLEPIDYYSTAMRDELIERHRRWLQDEASHLRDRARSLGGRRHVARPRRPSS